MFYSPLRYPGGKNKLAAFIAKVCIDNRINGHYIEPYAGGASVALFLLFEKFVNQITINDKDRSIYAFWHSVLNQSEALCELINTSRINIENWEIQREVQNRKETADLLELGFSTLYLNRTNRSGIIKGGMIGGRHQESSYKIDCRFNKSNIIERVKLISQNKNKISLYNEDAIDLIDIIEAQEYNNNCIFYFDPPYYLKADMLYMNHYNHDNHQILSQRISQIENYKWIVSYDNHPNINELYNNFQNKEYSFFHSAYQSRQGKEVLFFSDNLLQPNIENYNPVQFKLLPLKPKKKLIYKSKI